MIRCLLITPMLLAVLCGNAQKKPVQSPAASTYAATITEADLKRHLTIIAGADMEGRETGTAGQRKAAAYIKSQFELLGLPAPAGMQHHEQFFPLHADSMTEANLVIGNRDLNYGTDYYMQVSKNNNATVAASGFAFAGYGISEPHLNEYAGLNVAGKVVVLFMGEPKENGVYLASNSKSISPYTYPGLVTKMQKAREQGAVALLLIQQNAKTLTDQIVQANKKTPLTYNSNPTDTLLPSVIVGTEMAAKLFPEWPVDSFVQRARKSLPLQATRTFTQNTAFRLQYRKQTSTVMASNVLAVVEGSDKKNEYLFITAHYDHLGRKGDKIFYGADDDGSGTCAVLELAEAFKQARDAGNGPRRTLVFMTVSGEEKGLWGSHFYSENPVYPMAQTTANLNIDMVGRKDPNRKDGDNNNYVYVIGHDKLSTDLAPIIEKTNQQYTQMELDYKYDDPNDTERIYYRSDHYNFARKGVPILFFFDGIHEDYHRTSDTVDKINFDLYHKRVQLIFYTAWEMANRNNMLVRDIALPAETR